MVHLRFQHTFLFIVLLSHILYVAPARNGDVCTKPTYSCGSIPPVLKDSFTLKESVVDIDGKFLIWQEEYFDANNERAKLIKVVEGNEVNIIFNFRTNEGVTYVNYHPGADPSQDDPLGDLGCTVENLMESENNYLLRYRHKYGSGTQSRMYSSNEVLNYGGQHQYRFLKTETIEERGLISRVFDGCVYDEDDDKTVNSTFYWLDGESVIFPSITESNQQVPARIVSKGGAYIDGKFTTVNEAHDIVWFDGRENLPDEIFQIPPRMECDFSSRTEEKKPRFPNFFSARLEVMKMTVDWKDRIPKMSYDWQEEIWYDSDSKLVRVDFGALEEFTSGISPEFLNKPLALVFDFNTGVMHYTEKTFGKCAMAKIPLDIFIATKRPLNKDIAELASPNELFAFEPSKMFFKGKYEVRSIGTKAWSGRINTTVDGKLKEIYREFYISDGGWHEDYDDEEFYDVPIRDTRILDSTEDNQPAKTIYDINFYKFKKSQPYVSVYDISGCLPLYNRRFFSFSIVPDKDQREAVEHYYATFMDSLRRSIADRADVGTPLRVQELEVTFTSAGKYHVVFSLLDVPKETQDISRPDKGVDLETAIRNLSAAFESDFLEIEFKAGTSKVKVKAEARSLKVILSVTEEFVPVNAEGVVSNTFPSNAGRMSYLGQQVMHSPNAGKKESSGYSPGSLAGLSIAMLLIGAGIGIAAWFFYEKRKLGRDVESSRMS